MPGPPPPPPPGGPPPPPAFMPPPATKGGSNDRDALLQSIHKGAKLKKTVTVDKSGPYISGKTNQNTSNSNTSVGNAGSGARGAPGVPSGPPVSNGFGLGALFQDGIPKLKATGKNLGGVRAGPSTNSNTTNASTVAAKTPEILSQQQRSFAYTQKELKKQMASDNKNRGPPPPAPVRNFAVGQNNDDVSSASRTRNGTLNGFHNNLIAPNLEANSSSLYRKASSNVNLHSLDNTDSSHENSFQPRQTNNFGKPNLAPKPPSLNGKPKKLSLNGKPIVRTQSMKSPRSPSPQSGDSTVQNMPPKFGTVRNIPPGFAESLNNLHQKQRPPLNERPKAPPPSVPQQYNPSTPPPPSKLNMVKHPGHAPPPPPNINFVQASSNSAPPLPPHRTAPQIPSRIIPSIPTNLNTNGNAPPPPPRNSSIKDAAAGRRTSSPTDFDVKFANRFHDVSEFPRPSHFKNTPKMYSTRPVGNKQQAPLPPNHIHLGNNRLWDSSTC